VRLNTQDVLASHIRRADPRKTPGVTWFYDSHPGLPRGKRPFRAGGRERSPIEDRVLQPAERALVSQGDLRPVARIHVMSVVNKKLDGGVNLTVMHSAAGPDLMRCQLIPKTLLHAMWFQFAEELTGSGTYSECPICSQWFRADKHKDKVYCSARCMVKASRLRQEARALKAQVKTLDEIAEGLRISMGTLARLLATEKGGPNSGS
jgi:hypothetical protein